MTDTPDKPEDQPSGQPRSDEEERPQLREVSEDEVKAILNAHRKWFQTKRTERKEGKKADLSHCNLKEAKLQGMLLTEADLSSATLEMADLSEAKLEGAVLRRAHLYRADFRKADLRSAELQDADFTDAILQDANLQDASLDGAKSFLGGQLAGANVSGATLPEDIREFKVLQVVEETSKNARKIFLAMLLGCAYAWLTIATTTDARLLTNSASSPLPIIGTEIPIGGFYWVAPFILMGLYVYLHFYLELLWEGLAGLPARLPDGKRLDERAYPWLLNGLVRRHFKLLQEDRPLMAKLKELVTILLAWWVVPATLFGFWLRYLPRHEWGGTSLHIGLLVVSAALAVIFYRSAARTLRGAERQPFGWRAPWRDRRAYQSAGVVLAGVVLSVLSYGAIEGVRKLEFGIFRTDPDFTDVRRWVPWAFERLGYSTFANFREEDVSAKPANYWELSPEVRNESVRSASLRESDLRYADAEKAFLVKADLRKANLQGADLERANLQGADLRFANLQGANLFGAKLQAARLERAELQEANLRFAKLQGADLVRANLQEADLDNADLQGADLRFAKGLTQEQLDRACGDADTKLPEHLKDHKMKPCPEESK